MPCRVAHVQTYRGPYDITAMIDRTTPYGNPFRLEDCGGDRLACIARFAEWWFADERLELRIRAATELRDKVLLCWCAPLLCHGVIIAGYVNAYWLERKVA